MMASIVLTLSVITLSIFSTFLIVFLVCVLFLCHRHQQYDHLPGPKRTSFFCGNISDLTEFKGRLYGDVLLNHALVYGPVFVWWYYYSPVVVISSPELIKHGLVSLNLPKAPVAYNSIAYLFGRYRFLGSGIFTQLNHERWKHQRLLINPAFHRGYLKDLVPLLNAVADALVTKLMKVADGKTVINMADEFQKATLDAIAKVAFSIDLKCLDDCNNWISDCLFKCLEGYEESYKDPFLYLPFYRCSYQKVIHQSQSSLRKFAKDCIQQRMEAIQTGQALPNDILGMILQGSPSSISIEDLVDEFITFFIAGQDTTATQLSFALLETLLNEEIENRIFKEVDYVLGYKETVEYDDTAKLEYVGQTLKESLRKHPPAFGTVRITTRPEKFGTFEVPKGTKLNFSIYATHHLPEYWNKPERFNPDRFASSHGDNKNKISNFVYFPFSSGPRICIGKVFSSINATILMSRLFYKFKFKLVAGQTLQREEKLTLHPKDGVLCTIKERVH